MADPVMTDPGLSVCGPKVQSGLYLYVYLQAESSGDVDSWFVQSLFFTAEKMYYLNVSHFLSVDFLFLCVGEKLCMNQRRTKTRIVPSCMAVVQHSGETCDIPSWIGGKLGELI